MMTRAGSSMKMTCSFKTFASGQLKTTARAEPVEKKKKDTLTYHDAKQFGVLACNVHSYTFCREQWQPETSAMTTLAHTMK